VQPPSTASVRTLLTSVNARFLIPSRPPRSKAIVGRRRHLNAVDDDLRRRSNACARVNVDCRPTCVYSVSNNIHCKIWWSILEPYCIAMFHAVSYCIHRFAPWSYYAITAVKSHGHGWPHLFFNHRLSSEARASCIYANCPSPLSTYGAAVRLRHCNVRDFISSYSNTIRYGIFTCAQEATLSTAPKAKKIRKKVQETNNKKRVTEKKRSW